jgi:beta-N-acetylhexosaminidase
MGAIARHYEIEETVRLAVEAGEDMMLICARPDLIRRGYDSLLQAARDRVITEDRIDVSLRRIATYKSLTQPPLAFDRTRLDELSAQVAALNSKLNYTYGGKI